ncbi:hypothetical protein ScPMuIL_009107 [Solemya velum]
MAENMILYWGSGSPPCWRVMLALEEKSLSGYQSKLVSFSKKEHKGEEVLKLNPRGQTPTFRDGDVVVNESNAICFYLEDRYHDKGQKLLPDDQKQKAEVLQRTFEAANLQTVFIEKIVHYKRFTKPENQDEKLMEERFSNARVELNIWENYLKKNGDGAFIVGKEFTMADVFLFPYVAFLVRMGLQIEKFPALSTYYKRLCDRPSVQASWPPHWKEGPGQTIMSTI